MTSLSLDKDGIKGAVITHISLTPHLGSTQNVTICDQETRAGTSQCFEQVYRCYTGFLSLREPSRLDMEPAEGSSPSCLQCSGGIGDVPNKGAASQCPEAAGFQGTGGRCVPCTSGSPGQKTPSIPPSSHSLPLTFRQVILRLLVFLTVKQGGEMSTPLRWNGE